MLTATKKSIDFDDSRSSSVDRGERIFVNLEDVVLEEDKLSIMLEVILLSTTIFCSYKLKGLWQSWDIQKTAEEWWEITTCNSLSKLEVNSLFISINIIIESIHKRKTSKNYKPNQDVRNYRDWTSHDESQ